MQMLKWQPGALSLAGGGPFFVSATRFTYRHLASMPGVVWSGLALRSRWASFRGGYGVSIRVDLLGRSTYTVSVWRSQDDLRAFVVHPAHLSLMERYRGRLESSSQASWHAERFSLRESWTLATEKLRALRSAA